MHTDLNPLYIFGILLLAGPMVYMVHCANETLAHGDGHFHRDGLCQIAAEAIFWLTTAILIFPLVFAFHNAEAALVKPTAWWILYVNTFAYGVGFEAIVYLLRHPNIKTPRRSPRKPQHDPKKE